MMLSARRGAAPLLAAALLALDAAGAAAQAPIVRLPERDRALAGSAPQVFAIGRAEGADHEMFGEVAGVVFDQRDNLYVLDRLNSRVMAYDANGRFLRQIGREGEGPGELMVPVQLGITADGTLVVSDLARAGYSLFRTDGTFIRNIQVRDWMALPMAVLASHPRGGIVSTHMPRIEPGRPTQGSPATPLMFVPFDGGAPSQVFAIPSHDRVTQNSAPAEGGGVRVQVMRRPPPAFTPQTLYGVLPDGNVALSFTAGYTVRIIDLSGRTLRYLQATAHDRSRSRAGPGSPPGDDGERSRQDHHQHRRRQWTRPRTSHTRAAGD
jgi:6-bladed beta-propeller